MELQLWNGFEIWNRVMVYYCDLSKSQEVDSEEGKSTMSKIMAGLFSKTAMKDKPTYSEEIAIKGYQDVEHLMFQIQFPFELISSMLLKLAKQ